MSGVYQAIPRGLGRAPIQGLAIVRGLFVFGPTTPIAPSWEFCWG